MYSVFFKINFDMQSIDHSIHVTSNAHVILSHSLYIYFFKRFYSILRRVQRDCYNKLIVCSLYVISTLYCPLYFFFLINLMFEMTETSATEAMSMEWDEAPLLSLCQEILPRVP